MEKRKDTPLPPPNIGKNTVLHISRRRKSETDNAIGDLSLEESSSKESKTKRIRRFVADLANGLRIPMTNSGSGAAAVGQQPESSEPSDVNADEQQLFLMIKKIGAIQLQQATALQVWEQ